MKKNRILFLLCFLPLTGLKAQFEFIISAEGGFAGSTVKSEEIPVFENAYNSYWSGLGLTTQFHSKQGIAKGEYFHFQVGLGGEKCQMTLGFGRYLLNTSHNEARFSDNSGRDIWTQIKDASTEVGVHFILGKFVVGVQTVISLRTVSIYSQYVFPDDSRSLGNDHVLNGIFSSFNAGMGGGINLGYRILPNIYLVAKCDYVCRTGRKHPEYHQFEDLQNYKTIDYLPRDIAEYNSNPFTTDNAISNDVRGIRFGFGIQIMLSTFDSE